MLNRNNTHKTNNGHSPPNLWVFFKSHNIERTATFKKLIKQSPTSYFLFGGFVGFFSIFKYASSNSISFQTVFHQGYNFGRAQEGWARVWLDAKSCQSNRGSTLRDLKFLFFLLGQQGHSCYYSRATGRRQFADRTWNNEGCTAGITAVNRKVWKDNLRAVGVSLNALLLLSWQQ